MPVKVLNATFPSSPSTTALGEDLDSRGFRSLAEPDEPLEELTIETKIDNLLIEIHGKGRFTTFAFFALVLGMNSTGYYFYILTYLTMLPSYKDCVYEGA